MGRVWYRLQQLWRNLFAAPLDETAVAAIMAVLTPAEWVLFQKYDLVDRQHGYRVMQMLLAAGHEQPDLLAAALLHDVGKTRAPLAAWQRSLVVVGQVLWPRRVVVWGQGEPVGWRRPFVVKAQHPAWGAGMAAAAGSRPLTVELIQRHQEPLPLTAVSEADELLRWLQWADDQN